MRGRLHQSLFMMLATAVYGQSRYDVPFTFRVGDQNFAAGHYSISVESMTGGLLIWPEGGKAIMVRPQNSIQTNAAAPEGKLVFHCYKTACFLSQVWRGGDKLGMQLSESRAERELAKAGASAEATVLQTARR